MRHVQKAGEPFEFADWKASGTADWQPSFRELRTPQRERLHEALLMEQGGLCCYCGRSVDIASSHIEHFRPQAAYPRLELDYTNLHASCIKERAKRMPLHCGHAKASDFDEASALSPLDAQCAKRFLYTGLGTILPASTMDHRAAYMIDLLKLDIPFLRESRAQYLSVLDDIQDRGDLLRVIDRYGRADDNGKLPDFGHVIVDYARRLLAES